MQKMGDDAFHPGSRKQRSGLLFSTYSRAMSQEGQKTTFQRVESGRLRCVIATVAFGMGIDLPGEFPFMILTHYCMSV